MVDLTALPLQAGAPITVAHAQSSYPILVRDGLMSRAKAMSFFATGFTYSTVKAKQIQPQHIPFLGVYLIAETMLPDGDANAGEPRFRTTARYGFSVIIQNNDAEAAEDKLDDAFQTLTIGLLSDPTLYNNPSFQIQGFANGSRIHVFGNIGQDNELPIAELRFELTCDLGTITYPPLVPDDLETIHVETAFPVGGTQEEQDKIQQVIAQYDIEQEEGS